jgi:hypothetical protein
MGSKDTFFPLQSVVMHMSFDKEAQLLKTKRV